MRGRRRCGGEWELAGIQQLQRENLFKNLLPGVAEKEGFVTAEYSFEFLKNLHGDCPSIVAVDGDKIAGNALVALTSIRNFHDLLSDLFNAIDKVKYKGEFLKDKSYVVVGQLCVARDYRGQGLANRLYQFFRSQLSGQFDYCLTDVARDNPGSLKVHLKSGFQVVDTLQYGGLEWDIVLWDWNRA